MFLKFKNNLKNQIRLYQSKHFLSKTPQESDFLRAFVFETLHYYLN